ncbi:MAG: hypothetical protein U5K79_23270 [Cyclobacteriaceae bacterium]|nr:hypothetical protein [Cyclobacteriaceae bacterium]
MQIIVQARNNKSSEEYFWDNLIISAKGPSIPANATYNWYRGPSINGPIVYTGPMVSGMRHGDYTVIAIDNRTGCTSNPATITIDSTGYNIAGGYIERLAPFTNCKLPYDGALGAGVFNGIDSLTSGYIFEWYHQEDPKTPAFIKRIGPVAQNLQSREYTLIITEIASGCQATLSGEVVNNVIIPTISANTLADITSCSNPNSGSAQASVSGVTDGYDFEWFAGPAIGAGPPDYVNARIDDLPAGIYTVQAIDTSTFCTSASQSITISDRTVLPQIQVTVNSEQISCDTLALTGEISGAVIESGSPVTNGYTFNWFKGPNDVIPARPGYTGGPAVDGLEAGQYRLIVVTDGTNCTSFLDTLIQDNTVTPPDLTLTPTHVTSCGVPNGIITINVTGNPADYTYELYKGFGAIADSLLLTTNGLTIPDLSVGKYTVVAIDRITKCETNPATVTTNDATVSPTASFSSLDQVSCDPVNPTGRLTAAVGSGLITDYSFEWFKDNLSGAAIIPDLTSNGEVISKLAAGNYALRITAKNTQCSNVYYPSVSTGIVLPVATATTVASTACNTKVNGELNAAVVGVASPFAGYTFNFTNVASGNTWSSAAFNQQNLAPGQYNVTATNDITGCTSAPVAATISDNRILPTASFTIADQVSCNPASLTGLITAVPGSATAADYSYAWFVTNFSGAPVASAPGDGDIIAGQDAATYALRLTSLITECSNDFFPTINSGIVIPVASLSTVASTACNTKVNGELNAAVVGVASPFAGYTFNFTNVASGTNMGLPPLLTKQISLRDSTTSPPPMILPVVLRRRSPQPSATTGFFQQQLSPSLTRYLATPPV